MKPFRGWQLVMIFALVNAMLVFFVLLWVSQLPAAGSITAAVQSAQDEEPAVVVVKFEPPSTTVNVHRPKVTIHEYTWSFSTLEKYARAYWGLNTAAEKYAFTGVAVNRLTCGARDENGDLVFGNGTPDSVVTETEFAFYRDDAPASKENIALARLYLNMHMTRVLTKAYTGRAFPGWALYLSWPEKGKIAVSDEIGGEIWFVR